jgi:S-formylglutathione hydrolase FrmB
MAIREVSGPAGAPWQRPLNGVLDMLVVESETLATNPLGDPARRPLYVYRPPAVVSGEATGVPSIYVIQGFSGQLDMWFEHNPFELNYLERLDAMFCDPSDAGSPPAVLVFVDAWTSLGGSQFINSTAIGDYMDYLCDELVPFIDSRYPTAADRDHRGIAGKSSGGYGAMVVPMKRPDVFSALASHAGDALFEVCYQPDFRQVARSLRENYEGSFEVFLEHLAAADAFSYSRFGLLLNAYAMAAAYSPDPENPTRPQLPFEIRTGRLIPEVWDRWLAWDPVVMAASHADALRSMRRIYLDAGRSDEYFLELGAQAFSTELTALGVEHTLELFDGTHGGMTYRYPVAARELIRALSEKLAPQ